MPFYVLLGSDKVRLEAVDSGAFELRSLYITHHKYSEQVESGWAQPFDVDFCYGSLRNFSLLSISDGASLWNEEVVRYECAHHKLFEPTPIGFGYLHFGDKGGNHCLLLFEAIASSSSGRTVNLYVDEVSNDISFEISNLKSIISTRRDALSMISDRQYWQPDSGEWGLSFIIKRKRAQGKMVISVTISEDRARQNEEWLLPDPIERISALKTL
jgi:hypothetical protein